jgi:hypothetical protein
MQNARAIKTLGYSIYVRIAVTSGKADKSLGFSKIAFKPFHLPALLYLQHVPALRVAGIVQRLLDFF